MATKRKTGGDYLKEYYELNTKLNSLNIKMRNRLQELADIYPNAPITSYSNAIIFSKGNDIKYLGAIDAARYITIIEKYAEEQSGHVQTQIDFK